MTPSRSSLAGATPALWTIAIIALVWFLQLAAELLIPIVLGVLISYALEPLVAWFERRGLPRFVATSVVLLSILIGGSLGAYALRGNVVDALESAPAAARRARQLVMSQISSGAPAHLRQAANELQGLPAEAPGGEGAAPQKRQQDPSAPPVPASVPGAIDVAQQAVESMFALVGHFTVIVFLVFFLLLAGGQIRDRLVEIAGPDPGRRKMMATIVADVDRQIERFLLVQLVTASVVALATWLVLAWMGVANAAVWAVLAGVFNSIPYFGPLLVSAGLFAVGLVQNGGTAQATQMAAAAMVITTLEGWLMTPALMGRAERMNVLAVFVGLLVWTWIWGAWGTILAVPMLAVLKSFADYVPGMKPVSRLLAS